MMHKLFSIALIVLIFSGSVGIPLYQHTCSHENITINTLFTASGHCDEMDAEPAAVDDCCAKAAAAKAKAQIEKEPCCKEDVTRLAMSFNYFEHAQLFAAVIPTVSLSIEQFLLYTSVFPAEDQLQYASNSDPPRISGRGLLCLNCMLRL
jgi:hypothetical protein